DLVVLAVERRDAVGPGLLEDLHALLEHFQPDPGTGEPVPVSTPLVLVPTAADPHLHTTPTDVVGGRGDLRQVHRVAVGHAGTHLAEAHAVGDGPQPGHQGPCLVGRLLRGTWCGVEVVVDPDRLPELTGVRASSQRGHGRPVL